MHSTFLIQKVIQQEDINRVCVGTFIEKKPPQKTFVENTSVLRLIGQWREEIGGLDTGWGGVS